jgi:hypothetical protein
MKKSLLLILLITCSIVYAINTSEYKQVLINSLTNYFSDPDNSILDVDELKDLIILYFSSNSNTIDLSGTGYYSNEKLSDIYNKAKGVNNCIPNCNCAASTCIGQTCTNSCNTGTCQGTKTCTTPGSYSQQVLSAVKLDKTQTPSCTTYGYNEYCGGGCNCCEPGNGFYPIPVGQTVWFLIDPKGFTGKSFRYFDIFILDCDQGSALTAIIYTIDKYDNLWLENNNPYPFFLSKNTGSWSPRKGHSDEKRYLLKLTNEDRGWQNTQFGILWWGY